jgi:nucleoid-associated protein YgaU
MKTETRIAMVVGLLFIIMFGVVLSELTTGKDKATSDPKIGGDRASSDSYGAVVDYKPPEAPRPPAFAGAAPMPAPESHGEMAMLDPDSREEPSDVRVHVIGPEHPGSVIPTLPPAPPAHPAPSGPLPLPGGAFAGLTPLPAGPDSIPAPTGPTRTYKVKARDTLAKIAKSVYGPDHEKDYKLILLANKDTVHTETSLQVDQVLVIPPLPAPAPAPAIVPTPAVPPIARGPAVLDTDGLRRFVEGSGTPSTPGREVTDATTPHPAAPLPAATGKTYTVRPGDTLSKIARDVVKNSSHASIVKLAKLNKITDPTDLQPGMKLVIPS